MDYENLYEFGNPLGVDSDGNPVTLDTLCRRSPAWAASRIRVMEAQTELWRALSRYAAHTEECELSLYADGDCGYAGSPCERDEDDGHERDTCTCGHDQALAAARRGGR